MKRTPDVCVRATTISTVPLLSYPSIPSVRLPRVCDMYAGTCARYMCVRMYMQVCVRACMLACVHTTCVYSVPVRPATRSPSTTNTARTIVVSATAVIQGVPHNSRPASNRVVAYVCLKEQSGGEERRRGEEKQSTLVLE